MCSTHGERPARPTKAIDDLAADGLDGGIVALWSATGVWMTARFAALARGDAWLITGAAARP
jgi:hypothetical protein